MSQCLCAQHSGTRSNQVREGKKVDTIDPGTPTSLRNIDIFIVYQPPLSAGWPHVLTIRPFSWKVGKECRVEVEEVSTSVIWVMWAIFAEISLFFLSLRLLLFAGTVEGEMLPIPERFSSRARTHLQHYDTDFVFIFFQRWSVSMAFM